MVGPSVKVVVVCSEATVGVYSSLGLDGEAGLALSVLYEGWAENGGVDTSEVVV